MADGEPQRHSPLDTATWEGLPPRQTPTDEMVELMAALEAYDEAKAELARASDRRDDAVYELRRRGLTTGDVARHTRLPPMTVQHYANRAKARRRGLLG